MGFSILCFPRPFVQNPPHHTQHARDARHSRVQRAVAVGRRALARTHARTLRERREGKARARKAVKRARASRPHAYPTPCALRHCQCARSPSASKYQEASWWRRCSRVAAAAAQSQLGGRREEREEPVGAAAHGAAMGCAPFAGAHPEDEIEALSFRDR